MICSIPNCGRTVEAKGFCNKHYLRLKAHGDPLGGGPAHSPAGAPMAWIRQHLKFSGDECLIWPFARNSHGYGNIWVGGKSLRASRLMCEIVNGPPPFDQMDAAHSCGNGHLGCVTPGHLSWKTKKENSADCDLHGTRAVGRKLPQTKLDESQALEILKRSEIGETRAALAKRFGVNRATIIDLVKGRTWKWLQQKEQAQ